MRHITLIIAVLALAIAAPAIAGKGGNGNGGGGGGNDGSAPTAKPSAYSPTLAVSWPQGLASTDSSSASYAVSGCGYDASYGTVTVVAYSPAGAAWTGVTVDANGCVSVSMFSADNVGNYRVDASQNVRNKDVVVATTSFVVS